MNLLDRVKRAALAMQRYNWEQGVLAQAFLESGDEETAIMMAVEGANRQSGDGRCAQIGGLEGVTDPCAVGEALIFACEKTGDPFLAEAKGKLLRWALKGAPRNGDGIVYHLSSLKELWVDSLYMLPPFLARAGYYKEALGQIRGYWRALWDAEEGLLAHRWADDKKQFIRKEPWGVGNGWACAGLARVIGLLPEEMEAEKQQLIGMAKGLLDSAYKFQLPDGMFCDVLNNPETFPEINAGQMFAYTVFRGVREGWLSEEYLPAAEKTYQCAIRSVDRFGLVRPVCGMPHFDHPGVAPEGQAFFILMASARKKLQNM